LNIFGRTIRVAQVPAKLVEFFAMGLRSTTFARPKDLWVSFLLRSRPPNNRFQMRDGTRIVLSSNPHDGITTMVVFGKLEYGRIEPGSTVIDIGANIGVFAVFSVRSGAKKVFCYEPNPEAFSVLRKNIDLNGFCEAVCAENLAVTARSNETIYIPRESSPYNQATKNPVNASDSVSIKTISLEQIVEDNGLSKIDYLKLDCEGAEYEILMTCPSDVLARVRRIRMELHYSADHSPEELIKFMAEQGFNIVKRQYSTIWMDR
jgi:FkbM family methyltransferase